MTTIWEGWSWAGNWTALFRALFVTYAEFAAVAWVWPALTNVYVVTIWRKATSFRVLWSLGSWWSPWSGSLATVDISTTGWASSWITSSKLGFTSFAGLYKSESNNKVGTLGFVTSAPLDAATLVSGAKSVNERLVWFTGWVWCWETDVLTAVLRGTNSFTFRAAAWEALGLVLVPSIAFQSDTTLLVQTWLVAVWNLLTCLLLASTAVLNFGDDGLVASAAGGVDSWAVTTDAVVDSLKALNNFTASESVVVLNKAWTGAYHVLATTVGLFFLNRWAKFWVLWNALSELFTAALVLAEISGLVALVAAVISRLELLEYQAIGTSNWELSEAKLDEL